MERSELMGDQSSLVALFIGYRLGILCPLRTLPTATTSMVTTGNLVMSQLETQYAVFPHDFPKCPKSYPNILSTNPNSKSHLGITINQTEFFFCI